MRLRRHIANDEMSMVKDKAVLLYIKLQSRFLKLLVMIEYTRWASFKQEHFLRRHGLVKDHHLPKSRSKNARMCHSRYLLLDRCYSNADVSQVGQIVKSEKSVLAEAIQGLA